MPSDPCTTRVGASLNEVRLVQLLVSSGMNDCTVARTTRLPLRTARLDEVVGHKR